ncbi:MAG: M48 family metallopeptidase [Deltaproteobacteria bacterium]|nr:M48 family metallopeptidase [Deltaproteobacteria bacterium]
MNSYLTVILLILIIHYLLDLVSDWLNVQHVSTELPEEFKDYYDAEKYRQSQNYLREGTRFGICVDTFQTLIIIVFVLVGGFNFVDRIAISLGQGPILTGLIFAGILIFANKILNLPFSLYDTFVIEEKYGFNKTTPKTYVLDSIKSLILTALIGGIVFAAVIWFFEKTGNLAWVYCWVAITLFQIFFMFIAPVVIMPFFNKFVLLEESELRTAIENYAKSQNFKMKGIFKMDGSKRSSKSNAFFTGFGHSRRIVLFDTLIERHSVNELVSILAHEMGHYKKKHIIRAIVRSVIVMGLTLFLLSLFIENEQLFAAFKMEHLSVYASLFFFGFLYTPIAMLIGLAENIISRKNEYEADAFAVETYGNADAMIAGLKKLSVDNLSNLTPHPFKVFISYSHPPVLERIKAIRRLGPIHK